MSENPNKICPMCCKAQSLLTRENLARTLVSTAIVCVCVQAPQCVLWQSSLTWLTLPGPDWPGEGALGQTTGPWQEMGGRGKLENPTSKPRKGFVKGSAHPNPLPQSVGSPFSGC